MKSLLIGLMICLQASIVFAGGQKETADSGSEEDTRTVVDDRGVQVELPKEVNRIATFPLPHPHIIAAIDGKVDRIIGASSMSVSAAKISVLAKIHPGLLSVETGYLEGLTLNVEELAKINPDVFFTDAVLEGMENLEKTGIPVVYMGLKQETVPYKDGGAEVFSPRTTMEDWVETTIEVLGKNESNARDIAKVWRETELELEERLQSVPVEEKPKVLIMFKTKGMMVAGEGTFGHYWIARTGGINAAEELSGQHPAFIKSGNFEDIMKWNPDIIYLSNFEDTMPEDLFTNSIDGQDWSQINAVKNKRVYRIPLGIYRWYPPSLDGPLMLKWMAQKNYPDLFTYNMEDEIRSYFKEFHHYDLSDEEISEILEPASSGNL
jgi:iron complex transport system substrate-binding protein